MNVLWTSYFGLLKDHFGDFGLLRDHFSECAVEELLWATLASVLWKSYFGLLRDHSGECAVEELLWATQGSLWGVCCGRATLGYSETTLGSVLWKSYFGLLRDHSGDCAVEELSWATGHTEVQSSKNLTTPQSYGWGKTISQAPSAPPSVPDSILARVIWPQPSKGVDESPKNRSNEQQVSQD